MAARSEIEVAHEHMTQTYCPFNVGAPAEHGSTKCRGMNCAAFDMIAVETVQGRHMENVAYVTVCGQKLSDDPKFGSTFEIPVYGCLRMQAPARLTRHKAILD